MLDWLRDLWYEVRIMGGLDQGLLILLMMMTVFVVVALCMKFG